MAIETICQSCSKTLRVADEHAGKQARCPACGTIYTVPLAAVGRSPLTSQAPAQPQQPHNPFGDLAPAGGVAATSSNPPSWSSRSFANPPAKETSPDRWFMRIDDGREFGPVDRVTLDQWYGERRIGATTQLKREGDANWQPAGNIFPSLGSATMPRAGTSSANPFAEQPAQYGYGQPAYGAATPGYPARTYGEPHRGGVIIALALVSWVTGCFFLGIAAWIMGSADLKQMRAGTMDRSGEGLTQAGMIIGAIHTVIGILGFGFFFLIFLAALAGAN